MLKKLSPVVLLIGACFFFLKASPSPTACAFCNSDVLHAQTFYEDELILALITHRPIFPGHCLIIPKRHVENFDALSENEILQMSLGIKRVHERVKKVFETSSYLLVQKNGKEVGQSVPHVHFHYIPRKLEEDSLVYFAIKSVLAQIKGPLSPEEMEKIVENLKY